MKRKLFQRAICFLLSVTLLLGIGGVKTSAVESGTKSGSNRDTAVSLEEMKQLVGIMSYEEYLQANGEATENPDLDSLFVDITKFSGSAEIVENSQACIDSFYKDQTLWQGFEEDDWGS